MGTSPPGGPCLSLLAPVPPNTFFHGQRRIARLRHGSGKYVEAAGILTAPAQPAKLVVKRIGTTARQLRDGSHAKRVEISNGCRPDRDEIPQFSLGFLRAPVRIFRPA